MKILDNYFDLMFCVIKADKVTHKEEIKLFLNMLKDYKISSLTQNKYKKLLLSNKPVDIDNIINKVAKNVSQSMVPWFVNGAFLMADADGKISKEEIRVIKQFFEKSGFSTNQFMEVKRWSLQYVKHIKKGIKLFKLN